MYIYNLMQEILNEYKIDFVPVIKPKKSSSFPSPFNLHIKSNEEDERFQLPLFSFDFIKKEGKNKKKNLIIEKLKMKTNKRTK